MWQSRAWETNKPGISCINENSFSRWIIEKSDGLTTLGIQKLSETVRDYAHLVLMSQTSRRAQIVGHEARNPDAQRVFLNTFENIVNRRVNIPEDIRRFQKTLQYARSKVDYAIGEFIYMLPSDMNLRIGNVRNYNNKLLISSPSFKIGTNLKINLDGEKDKPDVKSNEDHKQDFKPNIKSNKKHKPITDSNRKHKSNIEFDKEHKPITDSSREHKSNIKFNKEHKQDVKMIRTEPDTYEEEKVALVLGITSIFTVWWMFK